jgi:CDP-diacylglycerol--glycerol-3-phosphate 3-phosphatidyltransferase
MTIVDVKNRARRVFDPIVAALAAMGVPPLLVSLVGLALSLYGASIVADGGLALGGLFLILAGVCDILDGDVARRRGVVSSFGAFIDSTLDRVTEFAYFGGIILYVVNRPGGFHDYEVAVVIVALAGSVLTSYARARAEGLGMECKVGVMERPERIILLAVGLFLGYHVLRIVMTILAAASMLTFLHRVVHVYRVSRRISSAGADTQTHTGATQSPGDTTT